MAENSDSRNFSSRVAGSPDRLCSPHQVRQIPVFHNPKFTTKQRAGNKVTFMTSLSRDSGRRMETPSSGISHQLGGLSSLFPNNWPLIASGKNHLHTENNASGEYGYLYLFVGFILVDLPAHWSLFVTPKSMFWHFCGHSWTRPEDTIQVALCTIPS